MFEPQNLPFDFHTYLDQPQHLEHLRANLQSMMQQDLDTLESLLSSVEATLTHQQSCEDETVWQEVRRKQKEGKLFLLMAQHNRERSQKISKLTQLITQLLDFIEQQKHNNLQIQQQYQRNIDRLTNTIEQLTHSNKNVKSDVEIFKQQLERAQYQMDEMAEQHQEEQEEQREGHVMKDSKIYELEDQLQELKIKMKQSKIPREDVSGQKKQNKMLKYVYSQSQFFPISMLTQEYTRLTKELEENQPQSQKQIQDVQHVSPKQIESQFRELEKTLQHVLSRKSMTSHLSRQKSALLRSQISMSNLQKNQLCNELRQDKEFDILPHHEWQKSPVQLIYLDDEESLHHNESRNIFERLCQKENETMPTPKNSDHQTVASMNSFLTFSPRNSPQSSRNSKKFQFELKKSSSKREEQNQSKGFYSSMFNFVVNRRIKRASQKAGCFSKS